MEKEAFSIFQQLEQLFARHADPANAGPMRRYMKNHFIFFGIKSTERKVLSRQFIREAGTPSPETLSMLFRECFKAPQRELQYFVQDAGRPALKRLDTSHIELFHELIAVKSWWDSVDFLAPKLAGPLLRKFPDQITRFPDRWIESDNFWYQRSAILFQLDYKDHTDADRLFSYIRRRSDSKEFFVRKAAGWALRQYSKTEGVRVRRFIQTTSLAPLTIREGMKWLDRQDQLRK